MKRRTRNLIPIGKPMRTSLGSFVRYYTPMPNALWDGGVRVFANRVCFKKDKTVLVKKAS